MNEPLLLKRTWWQRHFSKIRSGSMRGSIFALVSSALGAGCLAVPATMQANGLLLGTLLLIGTAIVSYLGMNNISRVADYYKVYDYSTLVRTHLGRGYGLLLDSLLCGFLSISLVAYQLIIYDCVAGALLRLGVDLSRQQLLVRVGFALVVLLPLGSLKRLSGVRYISLLSLLSFLYLAGLIAFEFPEYAPDNDYSQVKVFEVSTATLPSFCICIYLYMCHMNIDCIYSEMTNPIARRMRKANLAAVLFEFVVYWIIGIFGYLSCLDKTPSLFYERPPPAHSQSDYLMVVGQLLLGVIVLVGLVCITFPCRKYTLKLVGLVVQLNPRSNAVHYSTSCLLVVIPLGLSMLVPRIVSVLQFLGATCTVFCNLLPAMLLATTMKKGCSLEIAFQLALAWVVCLVSAASLIVQLVGL